MPILISVKWVLTYFCLSCVIVLHAQQDSCTEVIAGVVNDEHDAEALLGATVYLVNADIGTATDANGAFSMRGLCPGLDTLRVSHIGCETVYVPVVIGEAVNNLRVELEHHAELLHGIEVHSHRNQTSSSDIGSTLSGEQLDRTAGADFAEVVEALPGVQTIATGANVGRPLIDGLGGSRIVVVQGSMPLASQDWGDEHALEIDPFAAANVQLSRTGATVRYGASSTGGTLLLDNPDIPEPGPLEGHALLGAESNARAVSGGVSAAKRISERLGLRVSMSGRKAGDARAPDYVLSNTAANRGSANARAYYGDSTLKLDAGYRVFAQETGILRAAHVGNLDDLKRAIASDVPLVIRPFTYAIDAPRQFSVHHWATANVEYALRDDAALRLSYSGQLNHRREYDVRRLGRSATPSLDLTLTTNDLRAEYSQPAKGRWRGSAGVHARVASNRNDPNTGTRELIPYYDAEALSVFVDERFVGHRWAFEAAGRLDYRSMTAQWSVPGTGDQRAIATWTRADPTATFAFGASRFYSNGHRIQTRLAYASRTPNPVERFADGLHHALAIIERGDTTLGVEHGAKLVFGYSYEPRETIGVHLSGYAQLFDGFIYQRVGPPRLTVRGAFPVYTYEQGDALLYGLDVDAHLPLGPLRLDANVGYLSGRLTNTNEALPDMAPLRAQAAFSYSRTSTGRLKDWRVLGRITHVARQTDVPDGLPLRAPDLYTLLGLEASGHVLLGAQTLGIHFTVANLLNASYRDYLDRLRFYAARPGRDIQLRLLYEF